jgi:hypothetical protein
VIRPLAPLAVALAAAVPVLGARHAPSHHLHRPAPPLPHSLSVDEQEWSVIPSQKVVASGKVHLTVYDRGMDGHNLVIQNRGRNGPTGPVHGTATLSSGGSATINAKLKPGTYILYCSMYYGTPESHYAKGMHTVLVVR